MKKIIVGLIIGMLFSLTIVNAATISRNITVHYDVVRKIVVEGVDKTPTDKKPFIYEGTTYVPLRYISESLGKEVKWDEKTGTVYIGGAKESFSDKEYLTDKLITYRSNTYLYRVDNSTSTLKNWDYDASIDFPADFMMTILTEPITGKVEEFTKGISYKAYGNRSVIYYDLDKNHSKLTGKIGYDHKLNNELDEKYSIAFYLDGKLTKEIELKNTGFASYLDIDVSGAQELSIVFARPEGNEVEPYINLVDMLLE